MNGTKISIFRPSRRRLLAALAAMPIAAVANGVPVAAGGDGAEARFEHSTVRLLDGGAMRGGARLAGIAMFLRKGWKTYWRVPGDSGMPPEFDFTGSTNLKRAEVLWPAPHRYNDPNLGETIGYKDLVVFPLRIEARDPTKPLGLRVRVNYALCSDMCIPAEATLSRLLPPPVSGIAPDEKERQLVARFLAQVPRADAQGIDVVSAQVRQGKGRPELLIALKGDGLDGRVDILVEGPETVSFCHPRHLGPQPDGSVAYFLPIDGISNPRELSSALLRLTILAGEMRVERRVRIP